MENIANKTTWEHFKEILERYGQLEPLTSNLDIPIPKKNDKGNKREEPEASDMDVDVEPMTKKARTDSPPPSDIIIQDDEEEEVKR